MNISILESRFSDCIRFRFAILVIVFGLDSYCMQLRFSIFMIVSISIFDVLKCFQSRFIITCNVFDFELLINVCFNSEVGRNVMSYIFRFEDYYIICVLSHNIIDQSNQCIRLAASSRTHMLYSSVA